MDFRMILSPVPPQAKFQSVEYYTWGGSMVRDSEGRCHLYYSRWPQSTGFQAGTNSNFMPPQYAVFFPDCYHNIAALFGTRLRATITDYDPPSLKLRRTWESEAPIVYRNRRS